MIETIQWLLDKYPAFVGLAMTLGISTFLRLFGSWSQLKKHYKCSLRFTGKTWGKEIAIIGYEKNNRRYMTIGINSVGLYLQTKFPFKWLQESILIPWEDFLEIEKERGWTEHFYCFTNISKPLIKIKIKESLFYKMSANLGENHPLNSFLIIDIAMESSTSRKKRKLQTNAGKLELRNEYSTKIFMIIFLIALSLVFMNQYISMYQSLQKTNLNSSPK